MMQFFKLHSIRKKLILIILSISLVAILLATFAFFLIGLDAEWRRIKDARRNRRS